MITLVTGGSKCGRSRFAEGLLDGFTGRKLYIATMQPFGEEAHAAIERHRSLRSGKGFETVERYTDIGGIELSEDCAVLIEDIGNLCANEMFSGDGKYDPADRIADGIELLGRQAAELVIVTSQVGSDGIAYDKSTAEYISVIGRVNARLALIADNITECVCGIPLTLKGKKT